MHCSSKFLWMTGLALAGAVPAFALQEPVIEFGAASSYVGNSQKPTDDQHQTLAIWFKLTGDPTASHDYDGIIGSAGRNSGRGLLSIFCDNDTKTTDNGIGIFGFPKSESAAYFEVRQKSDYKDGEWHLAVATVSGATFSLYIDGEFAGTVDKTDERTDGASFFNGIVVGADPGKVNRNFLGYLTEASVWTQTLSADQIKALYTNKTRLSGQESGLWLYWPMNDAEGEGVRDASGNGRVGTSKGDLKIETRETPFTAVGEPVVVSFASAEGEKLADDQVVIPNTAPVLVKDPFKLGYVFAGWSKDEGATILTSAEVAELKHAESAAWVAQFTADTRPVYTQPEVAQTLPFAGVEQKPEIAASEGYTVSWTGDWTHVGEHAVTLTLTDPEGSLWDDGTTEPKYYPCTITQVANSWTTEPSLASLTWTEGAAPTVTAGVPRFGSADDVTMTPADLSELTVGSATVTFSLAGTDDYLPLEKSYDVQVQPQGLQPTGDPDAQAVRYEWRGETGYWFNPASWQADVAPCFGYPNNSLVSANFVSTTCTAVGEGSKNVMDELNVKSADATIEGGEYTVRTLSFSGTNPTLTLTKGASLTTTLPQGGHFSVGAGTTLRLLDGAKFEDAYRQNMWVDGVADVTFAAANASIVGGFNVRRVNNFKGTFHNVDFDGDIEMAGASGSDYAQEVVFSGADSKLTFHSGTAFSNQGLKVRFEEGVNVSFTHVNVQFPHVGKNVRVEFVGGNTLSSGLHLAGDNSEVFYGAGVTVDQTMDFGMMRSFSGLTNARTVLSNATVKVTNQLYMPQSARPQKEGCGVTFCGDSPKLEVGNTNVYIGKATPADGEVLPSWRFILPSAPYATAPVAFATPPHLINFSYNTPFEFDVSAVKAKGRYPLFTFASVPTGNNAPTAENIALLNKSMSVWKLRQDGSRRTQEKRVVLGWDEAAKTIYADVAGETGMQVVIR